MNRIKECNGQKEHITWVEMERLRRLEWKEAEERKEE